MKEYDIDIPLKYSAMYYYNNKLYLLGGRLDNSYSKVPSSKVYSVDVEEFKNTKPYRIKTLSEEKITAKSND
ncbi:hypothetical protein ACQ9BO_08415 [Flavobacterium sp. P21]|uniref:hypothetical protein n=1 Tax=Flavobacterium sp. P21 TaxID=3423948 RepID=UPI003D66FCEC